MNELPNGTTDCVMCGRDNPHGLHMRFRDEGGRLYSDVVIPAHMRGWSHLAHGGIITGIMDEMMAWSAIHYLERFILTRSITSRFLRPVRIETPLLAVGRVKDRMDERSALLESEIRDAEGRVLASAQGDFALFTREAFGRLDILPPDVLDDMARLIGGA